MHQHRVCDVRYDSQVFLALPFFCWRSFCVAVLNTGDFRDDENGTIIRKVGYAALFFAYIGFGSAISYILLTGERSGFIKARNIKEGEDG
jgi:hypothetical protein